MPLIDNNDYRSLADEFRDVEMNKEYYARKLETKRRTLRYIDLFIALFAAGSAVLSFSFWNLSLFGLEVGQISLGFLTALAVVFAIAKPYFKIEDEIERTSSIQSTYSSLSSLLKDIINDVKSSKSVDQDSKLKYKTLRQVRHTLDSKEDKPADSSLVAEMQVIVNKRYPEKWFEVN